MERKVIAIQQTNNNQQLLLRMCPLSLRSYICALMGKCCLLMDLCGISGKHSAHQVLNRV